MSTITDRDQVASAHPLPSTAASRRLACTLWNGLRRTAPTFAVVALLGGLAVWGHLTDWSMPKFSTLIGQGVAQVEAWCQEHNVPEAQCIECNKSLLPAGQDYGWCKEHGIAQCPLEHPDLAQLKTTPVITAAMRERASRALALRPRLENNSRCALHLRRIQFASAQAVEKVGIDIAIVQERLIVEAITANGEVGYDQTRLAHLPSRVAGTVWRVEKQIGDKVKTGEILALIDAAEIGRAKGEFLQSISQLRLKQASVERLRPLAEGQVVAVRQFREAEAAYQEAKIRLLSAQQTLVNLGLPARAEDFADADPEEIARRIQFLGLLPDLVQRVSTGEATSNLFPLRAPLDGVVVERRVVEGEVIDTSTPLFDVADISHLWMMLHVQQEEAKYLTIGQKVLFRPSHAGDEPEIGGAVAWISTAADDQTRMVRVRVDLTNNDGRLRTNTFGTGRIVLREEPQAIVVPSEAVHWDGTCHVVFVRDKNFLQPDAPKFFHVRSVRLGVKDGGTTEVIAGLLPGEIIASKNSVVLEAQLLKSNLGAGCCEACMVKVKK
jgi:cobalt-zinc-cadmium efflux system membrane fusion protein